MAISGLGVAYSVGGFVLVYSGWANLGIKDTVTGFLKGTAPAPAPSGAPTIGVSDSGSGSGSTTPSSNAQGGSASQNQAIAKLLAGSYGWGSGDQWNALVTLWNSESNWDNTIWNTSQPCDNGAHAYGIPQACGHGTVKSGVAYGTTCPYPAGNAGNPPCCGGTSDAGAQITWGLAYITSTSPGGPTSVPLGGY